jgi:hypothetical protein
LLLLNDRCQQTVQLLLKVGNLRVLLLDHVLTQLTLLVELPLKLLDLLASRSRISRSLLGLSLQHFKPPSYEAHIVRQLLSAMSLVNSLLQELLKSHFLGLHLLTVRVGLVFFSSGLLYLSLELADLVVEEIAIVFLLPLQAVQLPTQLGDGGLVIVSCCACMTWRFDAQLVKKAIDANGSRSRRLLRYAVSFVNVAELVFVDVF